MSLELKFDSGEILAASTPYKKTKDVRTEVEDQVTASTSASKAKAKEIPSLHFSAPSKEEMKEDYYETTPKSPAPEEAASYGELNESNGEGSLSRNGWQRTSLKRTPNGTNGYRRWGSLRKSPASAAASVAVAGSNALANALYRSSSYHSSGRSSGGECEEVYSDSSLEGEVLDLTKKVHHLEEKFSVLAEVQVDADDRYARAKAENAELSTKLFMLEEQLRESELRADEKFVAEQKRAKDLLTRVEREKVLQLENLEIKLQMREGELSTAKSELRRLEAAFDKERSENNKLAEKCAMSAQEAATLRENVRHLQNQNRLDRESMAVEASSGQKALGDLKRQLESLSTFTMAQGGRDLRRNDSEAGELEARLLEAEEEIKRLKLLNKHLQEGYDELSAQLLTQSLEDGRNLLSNVNGIGLGQPNSGSGSGSGGNSLAAEFEAMSSDEVKLRGALKDAKEANGALRAYIDNILLNIVEHYPQLLEVKNKTEQIS